MDYVNHNKVKIYIKMSKNLSAKCYQEHKERLQKKAQDIKIFLKKKKKKKRQYGREC